ncbi:serine hydrolase [Muricauda sp. SCSIO 64092]|uniref:serine hydrolase n=1 Tax=Allomuricauda sp. SCSIO 64092 TaxID=2908842 RepID=UPI001FF0E3B9|nr:serine hydrolase [Muricauda sp. SCSIO 64092]UOY06221.1 serine hydrolase [Muricauda sp. SCSIO 64092]
MISSNPMHYRLTLLVCLLSMPFLFAEPIRTHMPLSNGAVAYAYPIHSIVVDGNSDDWPSSFQKYPIAVTPYGKSPKKEDFEAYFQVGHNLDEQALYLLITVIDDNHVVDNGENANWNTQDTYTLYLDPKHDHKGSGVSLFQFGENFKGDVNYDTSWDPDAREFNWDNVVMRTVTSGKTTHYEVKVNLGNRLKLNKTIGVDHVIVDKDFDDDEGTISFMAWGMEGGKSRSPVRLGDIVPVAGNTKIAKVTGMVKWKDTSIKKMTSRVRFLNTEQKNLWSVAQIDSTGNYDIMLPQGSYVAKPFWQFRGDHRIDVRNSTVSFTIKDEANTKVKDLELLTETPMDIIPEKGILETFDPNKPDILDEFVQRYRAYYAIPGVSLAVIKEGKVVYHNTYGFKNAYTQAPVDSNTLFEAASITKPVFAFAVCRLVEKGVLDLDRPLYTYLPFEEIAHDERYKLITARHVLSHQTGFPNWAWMNEDGKIDIKFTPGTAYGYSGEGFEYLKRVVAKITDKDVETVLAEEVLSPLGLTNTYFSENDYLKTVVANGHIGKFPTRSDLPKEPGMAWSMHTEAKAFASFALGLLEKKGLQPETYENMFAIQTEIDSDSTNEEWKEYFGLGIALEETPSGPAFGHGGNNGDFKCQFKIYSELNTGFIVFTNSNKGDDLHSALDEFLITGKRED